MRLLLDTSLAIAIRDQDPAMLRRAASIEPVPLISVLTVVELEGGVAAASFGRSHRRASLDAMYGVLDILPFREEEAAIYRKIVEKLGFSRSKIIDRMIAATAILADATVATLNARDFRGIADLRLEDWSRP